ncbi:GPW/gp25 family protein [Pasteurellaceae bacterium LIM206]|nr:GPW/gp25 family protein [Pasteurellaceae bacterium LIM206]
MNRQNGLIIDDENAHIKQSIGDILTTPIGSRIQRRDYGSNIPKLIYRPISRELMLQLASAAVMAITKWEPRVKIKRFAVILTDTGKITANLNYNKTSNNEHIDIDNLILGTRS